MTPRLTLADLATGLDSFGDRYTEIDVFADDLAEVARLKEGELPEGVSALDGEGRRFAYRHHDKTFILELSDDGVARLRRPADPPQSSSGSAVVGGLAGAAIGSALSKKGDGWTAGLVLGLLAGAALGTQKHARRVFTMRFDPEQGEWVGYDGGLVPWMKSELQGAG